MEESKIICDSDFVSSFLWAKEGNLLINLFEDKLFIPEAVINEIGNLNNTKLGQFVYDDFQNFLVNGSFKPLVISFGSEEEELMETIRNDFYAQFGKKIGDGELEMITLAIHKQAMCIVNTASNNMKDILTFIQSNQINNITTMDVLCLAYDKNLKTFLELENIKAEMVKRKRWLPSLSVQDYYNSIYKK
ncbi:hypothetical protein HS141_15650 [Cetobacterium somerae]|uniref:hypothetical protein n=1 Tax=Cetobacterium somerae TaxID=188913 RepID=UPI00211F01A8|nr:hypothetical protein [Cetobacterium somerae]MCQ9628353.1 hypothetical protein [Cetobacterium somerae]